MQNIGGRLLQFGIVAALAFMGGRASIRVSDPKLRDSLAVYRSDRKRSDKENDSLRLVILAARTAVLAAEGQRNRALVAAQQSERSAAQHGRLADSLKALLRFARTPEDSIRILGDACTEREHECADLRVSNDSLRAAVLADSLAKAGKDREIAAHLLTRKSDSTNQARADGLIGRLERQVRGCTLPLIGFPCPVGILDYNLDAKALNAGAGLPIKSWLTVSVTKRIWKP